MRMRTKALFVVLVLLAVAGAAHAGSKPKIKGKGIYAGGSRFQFVVKGEGGPNRVDFEHPNFGGTTLTGEIDCIFTAGALAIMSGVIDTPVAGGPYYFLLIAFDGKESKRADLLGVAIDPQPIDCEIDPEDLGSGPPAIERGGIVVKVPQS
jgi:hypothetical protein